MPDLTDIPAAAARPSVQAEVTPNTAHLGDIVKLTIRVRRPNGVTLEPPAFQKTLGDFEIRSSTSLPMEVQGGETIERFTANLQNFTTGQQPLPGLVLDYKDVLGRPHQLKTPELKVMIEAVAPGPHDKGGDIRGIKGVVGPVAWSPWWWALVAALILGAAAYLWQKRQRVIQGPPPPPPVPADETALKKLQTLKDSDWIATGKLKEFYSALSDILRGYLEDGFRIPALERTTTELMRSIQKHGAFQSLHQVELRGLLEECDLVKFAKFRPEPDEAIKAHGLAMSLVEQTRELLVRPPGGKKP